MKQSQKNHSNECCKISRFQNVCDHFREYCSSTSIHALKYFGEQRTLLEKLWWTIILIICIAFCGFMIFCIIRRFIDSPVTITVSTKSVAIHKIPFPAVTICPQTKVSNDYLNFTHVYKCLAENKNIDEDTLDKLDLTSTICKDNFKNRRRRKGSPEIYNFLNETKLDFFEFCKFLGKEYNCSTIFTPVLTDEGVCHSFNILDKSQIFQDNVFQYENYHEAPISSDWSVEYGFLKEAGVVTYPRRALFAGAKHELHVIMSTRKSDYATCFGDDNEGFKVTLHLPARIPRVSQEFFSVPVNHNVLGAIMPQFIKTSNAVRRYSPDKRDCFFPSERHLKYFKIYTQGNCLTECLTNFTLEICGCVAFHMPRHNFTPICGSDSIDCMVEAEEQFLVGELYAKILHNESTMPLIVTRTCACMPLCTNINYNLEISQNVGRWMGRFKMFHMWTTEDELYDYSSLKLYFKHNTIDTKQRNEVYGFTDFLSNFGGILGLFTGFSVLSFMEIIYFLTVRIFGNIRLYGNWSGATNN